MLRTRDKRQTKCGRAEKGCKLAAPHHFCLYLSSSRPSAFVYRQRDRQADIDEISSSLTVLRRRISGNAVTPLPANDLPESFGRTGPAADRGERGWCNEQERIASSRGKLLILINICGGQGKTIVQMAAATHTYVLRKLCPFKGANFRSIGLPRVMVIRREDSGPTTSKSASTYKRAFLCRMSRSGSPESRDRSELGGRPNSLCAL